MNKACFAEGTIIKSVGVLSNQLETNRSIEFFNIKDKVAITSVDNAPLYRLLLSNGRLIECTLTMYLLVVNRKGVQKKRVLDLRKNDLILSLVSLEYSPYHEVSPINDLVKNFLYNKKGVEMPKDLVFEFITKIKWSKIKTKTKAYFIETEFSPYIIANGLLMCVKP